MTTTEIRNQLKAKLGYNSRQVSVKERRGGYDRSFKITVRDSSVNIQKVKELAHSLQSVSRCERSGEILSGGNCWLDVQISEKVETELADQYLWLLDGVSELKPDDQLRVGRFIIICNYDNYLQVYDLEKERFFRNLYYFGSIDYIARDMAIEAQS